MLYFFKSFKFAPVPWRHCPGLSVYLLFGLPDAMGPFFVGGYMGLLAVATGYRVGKYLDGSKDVAIHQFKAGGKAQTAMSCMGPGIEINPADGENLVITRIGNSDSFVVSIGGTNQKISPDTARGERRIYSVNEAGDTIAAVAKFKNDGTMELNGATDSAVLFSELKSGFDQLVSDFNSFLTHVHGNAGTPPTPVVTPSTASVDSSESADVKLS